MPIFNHTSANAYAGGYTKGYAEGQKHGTGGIDTSQDTVTPETLVEGITAHDSSGQQIVGTLDLEDVKAEGYTEGVVDGRQAEHDEFWAEARKFDNPNPFCWQGLYKFAGRSWTNKNFKPPYDIVPRNANYMFCANEIKGDFQQILDDLGITIDFSNVISMSNCFAYSMFTKIPLLNTPLCTDYWNIFANATVLTDISFTEGCIGADIDFKHCPLNKTSLISVINGLSSTAEKKTVTLRLSAVNTAFETAEGLADGSTSEEWQNLTATKSNWTISLIDS